MRVILEITVFAVCWRSEASPAEWDFCVDSVVPGHACLGIRVLPGGALWGTGVWAFSQPSGCSGAVLSPVGVPGGSSGGGQGSARTLWGQGVA